MNQPVKSYSIQFIVDGASESISFDLSLQPVIDDFRGSLPQQLLNVGASSTFTGPLAGVTGALVGTTVTLTFASAPPEFDGSNNRIVYTATMTVSFEV